MKNLSHFRTHARALLACYLDMTPEQQRLARAYIQDKALPEVQALRNAAGTPGGALLICCKICNNLATTNNNAHILRKSHRKTNVIAKMQYFCSIFAHFFALEYYNK